jgi:hypothetical protein
VQKEQAQLKIVHKDVKVVEQKEILLEQKQLTLQAQLVQTQKKASHLHRMATKVTGEHMHQVSLSSRFKDNVNRLHKC